MWSYFQKLSFGNAVAVENDLIGFHAAGIHVVALQQLFNSFLQINDHFRTVRLNQFNTDVPIRMVVDIAAYGSDTRRTFILRLRMSDVRSDEKNGREQVLQGAEKRTSLVARISNPIGELTSDQSWRFEHSLHPVWHSSSR